MTSLFLSTFSSYLHIALLVNNKVVVGNFVKLEKELSKMALANIKKLFDSIKMEPDDIDNIICVEGPGSFTGLRVGVTIAKTYCYSLNKDLIPVSSLFIMATIIKDKDYIIPYIDARRGYVYAGIYNKEYKNVFPDQYIKFDDLEDKIEKLNGNYTLLSLDEFNAKMEALEYDLEHTFKYIKMNKVDAMTFTPNYLKKTEAEEKYD